MKAADIEDFEMIWRRGEQVKAPWDLVERQIRELARTKRNLNSGHPTPEEIEGYVESVRRTYRRNETRP